VTACAIAASGINPNAFGAASTLFAYRRSPMTANLIEWHAPNLWGPPYSFDLLLYAAALALVLSWRKVRVAHWILFAAFAGASLIAFRNTPLIGFFGPVLIAAYFPFRFKVPGLLAWTPAILVLAVIGVAFAQGRFLQLRVAAWTIPAGAADYLMEHHVTGPMLNMYEQGGYLIWRLWPQERVFIDGRGLGETVFEDYNRILYNAGSFCAAHRLKAPSFPTNSAACCGTWTQNARHTSRALRTIRCARGRSPITGCTTRRGMQPATW